MPAQILEYLAPAFVAYAATLATVTGGFGSLFVEPTVFSCSRLPRLVHTCSLSNGCCCALLKFRLLICNEVHCAAPRCLRWFAPQLPRRLSAAASTALSWVTGSCCQVSCSTFLYVAFICPCERKEEKKKTASRPDTERLQAKRCRGKRGRTRTKDHPLKELVKGRELGQSSWQESRLRQKGREMRLVFVTDLDNLNVLKASTFVEEVDEHKGVQWRASLNMQRCRNRGRLRPWRENRISNECSRWIKS